MVDALAHRGPDDRGEWVDEGSGIGLGQRRLSIRDLSPAGHQPMESSDGRWVVTYNGEIYNAEELRADLKEQGSLFRGTSDTEVLVEGIANWGVKATVTRSCGMFAFAAWDRRDRRLYLVRDRLGIKPLYWAMSTSGDVLFGSELKALQSHPRFDRRINQDSLARYLRYSYVPGPGSIWQSCWKLNPGTVCVFSFRDGAIERTEDRYWSLEDNVPVEGLSDEEMLGQLQGHLRTAVRERLVSDVPLGVLLSGGIDSSLVAALAAEQSAETIKTFSAGFEDAEFDESHHAKQISKFIGTDHTELIVTEREALEVVPTLPMMYDEPFGDSSQIPTHLVCKLARSQVTVALTGDGGDETFGGYFIYSKLQRLANYSRRIPSPIRSALGRIAGSAPRPVLGVIGALGTIGGCGRIPKMDSQRVHTAARLLAMSGTDEAHAYTMSSRIDIEQILGCDVSCSCNVVAAASRSRYLDPVGRAMFADSNTYLVDDILTKVDRASMACSLEARVPLLDHRVIDFAWTTPISWRRRDGIGKWPLRALLAKYVPMELWDRPKQGFGAPIQKWLQADLREWGGDLVHSQAAHRLGLHHESVSRIWAAVQRGDRRAVRQAWTILMLLAWSECNA
jgi:asparagine synthase (glutamine-hydrolysing)